MEFLLLHQRNVSKDWPLGWERSAILSYLPQGPRGEQVLKGRLQLNTFSGANEMLQSVPVLNSDSSVPDRGGDILLSSKK